MHFIKPQDLTQDSIIIDVRCIADYNREHLFLPHILITPETLDPNTFMDTFNISTNKQINILCTYGGFASNIALKFEQAGYKNVAVIVGGIEEAKEEGLRIIKSIN